MFNFLFAEPYEQRKVDRFEQDQLIVDTVAVNDADNPFETAILYPEYNNNEPIVVEEYVSKEDAQSGHDKWVKIMTSELPSELKDVSTSEFGRFFNKSYPRIKCKQNPQN